MEINIQDVIIKTATIEVKVLSLSKKQVTLAVFRQLESCEEFIDMWELKVLGILWGRINYHVNCSDFKKHIHLIWQKEDKLKRAVVYREYYDELTHLFGPEIIRVVNNYYMDDYHSDEDKRIYKQIKVLMSDDKKLIWDDFIEELDNLDQLFIAV